MLALITVFLLLTGFILLLLVSLSLPITHTIYVLHLTAHVGTSFPNASACVGTHFKVLGHCISSINV